MSDWKLLIENIGGFKEPQEFLLKEGLNLVLGDNATGKTSLINALKLLNNLNEYNIFIRLCTDNNF